MSGTQSGDFAVEYDAKARARQGARRGHSGPPLKWLGLIAVLLVAGIFVYQRLDLNLWTPSDPPSVMAEGGCLDFEIEPADAEPPMSLDEVVVDIHDQTDHLESRDVHWAKFGYPFLERGRVLGGGNPENRTPVWTIVFEDEFDQRTVSRLWNEREGERFTVLYDPEDERITRSCGGGYDLAND